jgi:hypothetical protein
MQAIKLIEYSKLLMSEENMSKEQIGSKSFAIVFVHVKLIANDLGEISHYILFTLQLIEYEQKT